MRRINEPIDELKKQLEPTGVLAKALAGQAALERHLQQNEAMRRLTDPLRVVQERHDLLAASVGRLPPGLHEAMEAHRKMAEGPFAEMQRAMAQSPFAEMQRTLMAAHDATKAYGTFRLPPAAEIGLLTRDLAAYDAFSAATLGVGAPLAALTTMEAMRNPWLDIEQEIRSARALGDLVAIGRGVADLVPFEAGWTGSLRSLLGDWRDPIPSTASWSDRPARLSLYQERGLDPALTHFPPEAFEEAVELVGLREGQDQPLTDLAEDEATARSLRAFEKLLRLERALRRFIADAMEAEFGADWMRRQMPGDMFEDWRAKQAKATEAGQPECPLIEYADFTHYRTIIERKDNWLRVFKRVFGRQDDVRESFQRLFPLRIATMHARPIEQDDELLLLVETARLLKAIRN
jgi:hypothetical protein